MKVSELHLALLDYWVAKAEGYLTKAGYPDLYDSDGNEIGIYFDEWNPSQDWKYGGPIIDREKISVIEFGAQWGALHPKIPCNGGKGSHYIDILSDDSIVGETALIAAMRAYVVSKFGDEVPEIGV